MKMIAIEEHYRTEYYLEYLQSRKEYPKLESVVDEKGDKGWRMWNSAEEWQPWLPWAIMSKLCDIDEVRLKEMDKAGIEMQVFVRRQRLRHNQLMDTSSPVALGLQEAAAERFDEMLNRKPEGETIGNSG